VFFCRASLSHYVEEVFLLFNSGGNMKKIAVISAILDDPLITNVKFNDIVADFQPIIRGRMGLPFPDEHISVVSLTVCGDLDEINELTGKLGNIQGVTVKTAISKKTL
jgi:putative iron-only hydrogenase system regulator